jgi:hypothetical protein
VVHERERELEPEREREREPEPERELEPERERELELELEPEREREPELELEPEREREPERELELELLMAMTLRFDEDITERLRLAAFEIRTAQADIVRQAVADWLDAYDKMEIPRKLSTSGRTER